MSNNISAYDQHVNRLKNAWKEEDEDDPTPHKRNIVPDGGRVRINMVAMDSTQHAIADQNVVDERVSANQTANQATLDAAQRNQDRAQAFADHFTAQREAEADDSAYGDYCRRISDAWQGATA